MSSDKISSEVGEPLHATFGISVLEDEGLALDGPPCAKPLMKSREQRGSRLR
jgi:hypothetical protein